jgi:hypothetical protein
MTETLVTVDRFHQLANTYVARSILEANGIECFIPDENLILANFLYAIAIGGIRLQVRGSQASEARTVLEDYREGRFLDTTEFPETEKLVCPACKSTNLRYTWKYDWLHGVLPTVLWVIVVILVAFMVLPVVLIGGFIILALPLLFARRAWRCKDCGNVWTE